MPSYLEPDARRQVHVEARDLLPVNFVSVSFVSSITRAFCYCYREICWRDLLRETTATREVIPFVNDGFRYVIPGFPRSWWIDPSRDVLFTRQGRGRGGTSYRVSNILIDEYSNVNLIPEGVAWKWDYSLNTKWDSLNMDTLMPASSHLLGKKNTCNLLPDFLLHLLEPLSKYRHMYWTTGLTYISSSIGIQLVEASEEPPLPGL